MLENRPRPARAVIEVLPRERTERLPRKVCDGEIGAQPDFAARLRQPHIKLGVSVVSERFVVTADRCERCPVESGMMAVLDIAGFHNRAVRRAAVSEPAV